jgi:hypothetical protein
MHVPWLLFVINTLGLLLLVVYMCVYVCMHPACMHVPSLLFLINTLGLLLLVVYVCMHACMHDLNMSLDLGCHNCMDDLNTHVVPILLALILL